MTEMKENQEVFPVPGKENRAVTVWVEEARDGKPHWYDFTEEEARKVDFDKAFPNGYVDYYIVIDKDGIIQSDTMEPLRKGTRFTDSYANFKCPEHSYVKDRMEEVAEAVQDSFRALCVDANIRIEGRESGEPHFVICTKGIQEDTLYELPGSLDTLSGVARGMEKVYRSYDVDEERKKYKPGRNGLPEGPYLENELRYIKKVCHRIADACKAAERIGAGEEEDKVYQEYHDAWLKEDVKVSCKPRNVETMKEYLIRGIQDLAKDYQNTFDIPQKDIEKALRRACKEIPSLTQEKQASR